MFKKLIEFFTGTHSETVSRFPDASKNREILEGRADRRVSETKNISDKKPEHNRRKTDRIESSRSSLNREDSTHYNNTVINNSAYHDTDVAPRRSTRCDDSVTASSYSYSTDSSSCSSDSGSCGGGCD